MISGIADASERIPRVWQKPKNQPGSVGSTPSDLTLSPTMTLTYISASTRGSHLESLAELHALHPQPALPSLALCEMRCLARIPTAPCC